jgi:hypothetical protein
MQISTIIEYKLLLWLQKQTGMAEVTVLAWFISTAEKTHL